MGLHMQDKTYCVYRHTFPNGKVYIGYTGQKPVDRWCNGTGYKNQQLVYRAILRYGWDNITHDVISTGLTLKQASNLEVELINAYDSTNPERGYNVSRGGVGGPGLCGEKHPMYGKTHTEESRKKISESLCGRASPMKGQHTSDEVKEKLRKANLGKKQNRTVEWNENISSGLRGKCKSAESVAKIADSRKKPIVQISLSGEVIQEWPSAKDASQQTGIDATHISLVCRNIRETAGGFSWKFTAKFQQ